MVWERKSEMNQDSKLKEKLSQERKKKLDKMGMSQEKNI